MPHDYDIAIIGGGMVGASLAIALAPSGIRIAVIESVSLNQDQQPSYDDRGITLSPSSRRILEGLVVWDKLQAVITPIKQIHVSEQGRFGFTHLDATEINRSELAYVSVARSLGLALYERMAEFENIDLICPAELKQFQRSDDSVLIELSRDGNTQTLTTTLIVGADGSRSLVRRLAGINIKEHDYKQTAIVANITTQRSNNGVAYERFTPNGPIALLPIAKNRSVLVFVVGTDDAERYLSLSDEQYCDAVLAQFGRRLGQIEKAGQRRTYPIHYIEALEQYQQQLVLLGNAAHTIHPNAAQGFNLGLRDVAGLADCIHLALDRSMMLDDVAILENYVNLRCADQKRVMQLSNGLAKSFYNRLPVLGLARNLAMLCMDVAPSMKTSFMQNAMGLSGRQPRLVQGLSS